jgi:nucleotide-binding universal stress UspA family protein
LTWRKPASAVRPKNRSVRLPAGGERPFVRPKEDNAMYHRILVPIDGSPTAERGLREAIRLAAEHKGKLRLLHVVDDLPGLMEMSTVANFEAGLQKMRDYGASVLAAGKAAASRSEVETDTILREVTRGRIADVVIEEAKKAACDLVVMGTHGRRGFSRLALGSDADLVVRGSPVPVLLVRQESVGQPASCCAEAAQETENR